MSSNIACLILPVAGKSSRFPNMRPKFLLTHPSGCFMITESIRGLSPSSYKMIILIALREDEEKYNFSSGLINEIQQQYGVNNHSIKLVLLDKETKSQAETVYLALKKADVNGPILIKDCDNYFPLNPVNLKDRNFVAVGDLHDEKKINPGNKSYVVVGNKGVVENIVEKQVISNLFCSGAYYFYRSGDYITTYELMKNHKGLYISHIIYKMLLEGYIFFIEIIRDYFDWGTLIDWQKFTSKYGTVFIDLDGVLVYNSGKNFEPKWGKTEVIQNNANCINRLYESGKVKIIITTSRDEKSRQTTVKQLNKYHIKYHDLYMGLPHGKRILINDFSPTNPYPSAISINIKRDDDSLFHLISTYFE